MEMNSKEKLKKFLEKEISICKGKVIIQAGHFALVYSKERNKLIPGVYQDVKNEEQKEAIKGHPYAGNFPLKTFEFGVNLMDFAREQKKDFGMTIIVNDWQWVPKMEEGKANPYRNEFYKENKLPKSYEKVLAKKEFNSKVIIPMENKNSKQIFFSEQKLRNKYRNFKKICSLGENECAREYVPFLNQMIEQNAKLIISFVPKTCKLPINAGSEEVKEKFKTDMKIINIFANGISKNFFKDIEISII